MLSFLTCNTNSLYNMKFKLKFTGKGWDVSNYLLKVSCQDVIQGKLVSFGFKNIVVKMLLFCCHFGGNYDKMLQFV